MHKGTGRCKQQQWPTGDCDCNCWQDSAARKWLSRMWRTLLRHGGRIRSLREDLINMFGGVTDAIVWATSLIGLAAGRFAPPPGLPLGLTNMATDIFDSVSMCPQAWSMLLLFAAFRLWMVDLSSQPQAEALSSVLHLRRASDIPLGVKGTAYNWALMAFDVSWDLAVQCNMCLNGQHWPLHFSDLTFNRAQLIQYAHAASFPLKHFRWRFRYQSAHVSDHIQSRNKLRMTRHSSYKRLSDLCPAISEINVLPNQTTHPASITCFSPAVWPEERGAMAEMAATYMRRCEWCLFFVSVVEPVQPTVDWIGPCKLVNLGGRPLLAEDRRSSQTRGDASNKENNQVAKVAHSLIYLWNQLLQDQLAADWFCILETDLFFIPENFRRLVALLGFTPEDAHWLGHSWTHSMTTSGILMEPPGSCLSKQALKHIGRLLQGTLDRQILNVPTVGLLVPNGLQHCNIFASRADGNTVEYLYSLNICFRMANVNPADPQNTHDLRGRRYFAMFPLDFVANRNYTSPAMPPHCSWYDGQETQHTQMWYPDSTWFFKGMEHMYMPCMCGSSDPADSPHPRLASTCNEHWVADFPVMFHGHLCTSCETWKVGKYQNLRMAEVDRIFHGSACQSCQSFLPRIDWRFRADSSKGFVM